MSQSTWRARGRDMLRYLLRNRAIEPVARARWPLGWMVLGVVAYSEVRAVFECMWIDLFSDATWYACVAHNYPLYGLLLAFAIPSLADAGLGVLTRTPFDPARLRALLNCSVVIWAVAYPIVPVVSMLTGSPFFRTIPLFAHLPGFMTSTNFLPSGMWVAIAVIFAKFPFALRHLSGCKRWQAWLSFSVATLVTYLIYYQWGLQALYRSIAWVPHLGHVPFFSAYSLSFVLFLLPWVRRWWRAFPEVRPAAVWAPLAAVATLLVVLPRVGVVRVLQVHGLL